MPRLSKLLEKIEDLAANRWGSWYERNKARVPLYAVLGASAGTSMGCCSTPCGSERNPYFT